MADSEDEIGRLATSTHLLRLLDAPNGSNPGYNYEISSKTSDGPSAAPHNTPLSPSSELSLRPTNPTDASDDHVTVSVAGQTLGSAGASEAAAFAAIWNSSRDKLTSQPTPPVRGSFFSALTAPLAQRFSRAAAPPPATRLDSKLAAQPPGSDAAASVWTELHSDPSRYCSPGSLSIRVFSWNVAGNPVLPDVDRLLGGSAPDADVYIFHFQEIIPLNAANMYSNPQVNGAWRSALLQALNGSVGGLEGTENVGHSSEKTSIGNSDGISDGISDGTSDIPDRTSHGTEKPSKPSGSSEISEPSGISDASDSPGTSESSADEFSVVAARGMLGLYSLVIARRKVVPMISQVECSAVGTGFLGVWGNKGAVSVRFRYGADEGQAGPAGQAGAGHCGMTIQALNVHLAAGSGPEVLARRRKELADIVRKIGCVQLVNELAAVDGGSSEKDGGSSDDVLFDSELPAEDAESSDNSATDEFEITDSEEESERGEVGSAASTEKVKEKAKAKEKEKAAPEGPEGPEEVKSGAEERKEADSTNSDSAESSANSANSTAPADVTIIAGDLNYRTELPAPKAHRLIELGKAPQLLSFDSLSHQRAAGLLPEFTELPIRFRPTYKYSPNVPDRPFASDRPPSYTDRILFRCATDKHSCATTASEYSAVEADWPNSDHNPVSCRLEVQGSVVDVQRKRKLLADLLRAADLRENAARPAVVVEPLELCVRAAGGVFGADAFTVTNVGPTVAEVSVFFADAAPRCHIVPQKPSFGGSDVYSVAQNGSATFHLVAAPPVALTEPHQSQDGFLIVRVADGQDVFVSFRIEREPSAFGLSLAQMARLGSAPASAGLPENAGGAAAAAGVPKEIWTCVDFLWSRVTPGLFAAPALAALTLPEAEEAQLVAYVAEQAQQGNNSVFNCKEWQALLSKSRRLAVWDMERKIRACVDAAGDLTDLLHLQDPAENSAAAPFAVPKAVLRVLLQLLRSLPDGIVPAELDKEVRAGRGSSVLEKLPGVNANVLIYLCSFARHCSENGVALASVASALEPVVFRGASSGAAARRKFLLEMCR